MGHGRIDDEMDDLRGLPDKAIDAAGPISDRFLSLGVDTFLNACRYVHELPYGYNSSRDDLMILFKERFGSCTTKHAVIATLATELGLPVVKAVGIYAMTEDFVAGADRILVKYNIPYVPMLHCFLAHGDHHVDLTEGNDNGKKRAIDSFLFTRQVIPNITARDEYLLYRKALSESILNRKEWQGADLKRVLHAREEGLALLKANLNPNAAQGE
jgi:hypothetical protein